MIKFFVKLSSSKLSIIESLNITISLLLFFAALRDKIHSSIFILVLIPTIKFNEISENVYAVKEK
jgi:hypothetical protein